VNGDPGRPGRADVEPVREPAEEIKSLQRCLNDLVSVLALPAMWPGGDARRIVNTLLDALVEMLGLDLAYARLKVPAGEAPFETVRLASSMRASTEEIRTLLTDAFGNDDPQTWPSAAPCANGNRDLQFVPMRLGLQHDAGVIVAASCREDFPQQTERLLLSVAANQAAIALQEARLLEEQRRTAEEMEWRAAQRTRELAAAVEELQLRVSMLQQLPAVAWCVTPDGTPDIVNQSWFDYSGQTPEVIHSRPDAWMDSLHPDDRQRVAETFRSGIRSGEAFTMEARFRRQDGTYRWHLTRATPIRDSEGNILRFVGTTTDIEDQKRAQQRVQDSELSLRLMTETIPEMLWSATPDGAIDYCNGRLLEYSGFESAAVLGQNWVRLLHPDDVEPTVKVWARCVATGDPYRVEVRTFHAPDRTYRWCVTSALPLLDAERRILKWYGTVVDMHDWKQAQDNLRSMQAELAHMARVMTMGELTASIAHEVNQPLAGIITNANTCLLMLGADPPNVEGARETARRTIRDGNRAANVISRLRTLFARKEIVAESVDLNEATREVITLFRSALQRNRVRLRLELAESLPLVTGDRVQLQQVILNLLTNASEAMASVEDRHRELLVSTGLDPTGMVRVTVRDNGVGIGRKDADKIFTAFYTTKRGGMGVGLSVSRSIIEGHRGRLWASSNEGPGATLSFAIPQAQEGTGPRLHYFADSVRRPV